MKNLLLISSTASRRAAKPCKAPLAVLAQDAPEAERSLLEFYNAYLSGGAVPYGGLPEKMRAFYCPLLALDYVALLDGLGGK